MVHAEEVEAAELRRELKAQKITWITNTRITSTWRGFGRRETVCSWRVDFAGVGTTCSSVVANLSRVHRKSKLCGADLRSLRMYAVLWTFFLVAACLGASYSLPSNWLHCELWAISFYQQLPRQDFDVLHRSMNNKLYCVLGHLRCRGE